ncbi:hypothetical protein [Nocardioides dongkuii]|uniref:hypothetical protein n=1 Tax=Nocardioides dongkuii TaxID=2760089 RepID=UPI0015FCD3B4|nr:hypothetical protein [Nocardioides dongkuii]
MSETRPPRVRVSGPPRRRTAPVRPRARDIDADTRLGGIYLGSLLRAQLGLAARVLTALVVTVGSWPLLFHLWPGLAAVELGGLPLAWLVLGVLVYPLLVALGWWYVRRAERHEQDFADLMGEVGR